MRIYNVPVNNAFLMLLRIRFLGTCVTFMRNLKVQKSNVNCVTVTKALTMYL